jgi:shikimate dehydrogenase
MDGHTSPADALRSLGLDSDLLNACELVIDFVYASHPAPVLRAAADLGIATVDGLAILVEQGALSFERWTGLRAPVAEMERAARGA